jgi:uncharacterized protein with HEPN domain
MRGNMPDTIRLSHIIECIDNIELALQDVTFDDFFEDAVIRAAVVHWLTVVGEAARYVSEETKNRYTDIEWKRMVGMRNVMVHRYFDIDYLAIWKATILLKDLKTKLKAIKLE